MSKAANHLRRAVESERLYDDLRSMIEKGRYRKGDRLETFSELADRYGITLRSVRTVMTRLEDQGLVRKRRGSGVYVDGESIESERQRAVAPSVIAQRRNQSRVVLLMDHSGEVWDELSDRLIGYSVAKGLSPMPMSCVDLDPLRVSKQWHHMLQEWREDPPYAIVAQNEQAMTMLKQMEQIGQGRTHLIRIGWVCDGWHSVRMNTQSLGTMAVDHLLAKGHRRIGLLLPARQVDQEHPENQSKSTALHTPLIVSMGRALRARGIRDGLTIHYHKASEDRRGYECRPSEDYSIEAIGQWLGKPDRPTAFVSMDYFIAAMRMAAIPMGLELGRDYDAIGIGNTEWSRVLGFSSFDLQIPDYFTGISRILESPVPPFGPVQELQVVPKLVCRRVLREGGSA